MGLTAARRWLTILGVLADFDGKFYCEEGNRMIFLTSQKDINVENPAPSDLYSVGTVGVIMRMLKLPDGRIKILVQGVSRAKAVKFLQKEPFYQVEIKTFADVPAEANLETEALMRNVKEQIEKLVSFGKVVLRIR